MPKAPCSELSAAISDLALLHAQQPGMNALDKIAERMQQDVPLLTRERIAEAIVEANSFSRTALTDAKKQVAAIKREARQDKRLREKAPLLEKHLAEGTLPGKRAKGPPPPEAIAKLRETVDDLQQAVRDSDPARRDRVQASIDKLRTRIDEISQPGWTPEAPPAEGPKSKALARAEFEREQLRRDLRAKLDSLKPKSPWSKIQKPFNTARAIMTSLDFSAVLRQGGFVTFSNPLRSARALLPMIRAMSSEYQAHRIMREIDQLDERPLMARAGLRFDEIGSPAEEYANVYRIPGVQHLIRISQRGHEVFLNKVRADSFVTLSRTLARNGEPTLAEAKAIANFVNVTTGKADLGRLEGAAQAMNGIFFAPRYMFSRFQLAALQPLYSKHTAGAGLRVRLLIAKEYAKALIGMGLVLALWQWATGEEVVLDPSDSRFLKLKVPGSNYHIDIAFGMSQTIRLVAGSAKSAYEVQTKGEPVGFGKRNVKDIGFDFLATKFAPLPAYVMELATRETAVGEATSPLQSTGRLVTPLSGSDVLGALRDLDVPENVALGLASLFGAGLQNYEQNAERRSTRRRRTRRQRD